jgi:hypothetical protein
MGLTLDQELKVNDARRAEEKERLANATLGLANEQKRLAILQAQQRIDNEERLLQEKSQQLQALRREYLCENLRLMQQKVKTTELEMQIELSKQEDLRRQQRMNQQREGDRTTGGGGGNGRPPLSMSGREPDRNLDRYPPPSYGGNNSLGAAASSMGPRYPPMSNSARYGNASDYRREPPYPYGNENGPMRFAGRRSPSPLPGGSKRRRGRDRKAVPSKGPQKRLYPESAYSPPRGMQSLIDQRHVVCVCVCVWNHDMGLCLLIV